MLKKVGRGANSNSVFSVYQANVYMWQERLTPRIQYEQNMCLMKIRNSYIPTELWDDLVEGCVWVLR